MHKWPAILIADDEKNVRFLTSEVFRLEGIESAAVSDGCQVVAYLEDVHDKGGVMPRVVILDMMMPCLDGYQVYDQIVDVPWMQNTAIVIVSATRNVKLSKDDSRVFILYKPYEVADLLDLVRGIAPDLFGTDHSAPR
jgi:CheY-like chemotaxis protein